MLSAWLKKSSLLDEDLLGALPSILSKSALRLYLTTHEEITTWNEFKKEFRLQFIAVLDKADIEEDLHSRTQAKGENITNFLSCFKYIVGHFKHPPSEKKLVKIAYKNILPEYRMALFNKKVTSLQMIKEYGVKLERQMEIDRRYTPPKPRDKMKLQGAAYVKNQRTARVVAAVRAGEEVSSSGEEETKKKSKKTKKEKAPEEAAVLEKQPPPAPVQLITSSPQTANPTSTAFAPPMSNAANYEISGGEQRRGRGKYDRGRNYGPPAEMNARRNEENGRFLGACYVCEETGHRANQFPRRECFACRQVGHIAPDCRLRPPRLPPNMSCLVCGQAGVVFANCSNCTYRRTQ